MKNHYLFPAMILWGMTIGCEPASTGPMAYWNTNGAFFDQPWPMDTRRDPNGSLDMTGFPNPFSVNLLDTYLSHLETLKGFGNNSPIFVRFHGPIDEALLPTPEESTDSQSPILLMDIDPSSPYRGELFPVQTYFQPEAKVYEPSNLLAIAPSFGFPLRPSTLYGLVITDTISTPNPEFKALLEPDHPDYGTFVPLLETLEYQGVSSKRIAIASLFTTGDPLEEMARINYFLRQNVAPPDFDVVLSHVKDHLEYTAYETRYASPVFTHGERPYLAEGGEFRFQDDGQPIIADFDEMRLSVCTPVDLSNPPSSGWPVVVYQHGTGGNYLGFCTGDSENTVASRFGSSGLIGMGIDQPLHGNRVGPDGDEASDLAHFNILNPAAAITNFRQGAADAIYLTQSLARRPWIMETNDGTPIPLDPDRILFMGHSQGGLTGAIAGPFLAPEVSAMMLSGAGGGISMTLIERKDPFDFAQFLEDWMLFPEDEDLHILHPLTALVQTLVEESDPINYAPYWFSQPGNWLGHHPIDVLVTSGLNDEATPYITAEAMATAGRIHVLDPPASENHGLVLRGLSPIAPPYQDNTESFSGTPITAGFSQWTNGDHFVIFDKSKAANLYQNFLVSSAEGEPTIRFGGL